MITYDLENGFRVELVTVCRDGKDEMFATVVGDIRMSAPVCPIDLSVAWVSEAVLKVMGARPTRIVCTDSCYDQNWREYEYAL